MCILFEAIVFQYISDNIGFAQEVVFNGWVPWLTSLPQGSILIWGARQLLPLGEEPISFSSELLHGHSLRPG